MPNQWKSPLRGVYGKASYLKNSDDETTEMPNQPEPSQRGVYGSYAKDCYNASPAPVNRYGGSAQYMKPSVHFAEPEHDGYGNGSDDDSAEQAYYSAKYDEYKKATAKRESERAAVANKAKADSLSNDKPGESATVNGSDAEESESPTTEEETPKSECDALYALIGVFLTSLAGALFCCIATPPCVIFSLLSSLFSRTTAPATKTNTSTSPTVTTVGKDESYCSAMD
ncbi:hypothetical protein QBC35DRAFT_479092 [Podospora australis]|uniref:Uncharacterized protein n=1 Tax=Podospora australis TaxID=1536484 RepID=A0AAN6WIA8_9PEZI|nr:hypothetical protein QBC35DRAFT_479092 [Podospora australis]